MEHTCLKNPAKWCNACMSEAMQRSVPVQLQMPVIAKPANVSLRAQLAEQLPALMKLDKREQPAQWTAPLGYEPIAYSAAEAAIFSRED